MAELIDVFDGNHKHLGVLERTAVHQQGLWHQTFHCWVVGKHNSQEFVLLQLRSKNKKSYSDMLDITAAGHLEAGESPDDGAREVQEELGVQIGAITLRYLGIKHDIADEPNGLKNREFSHVFLMRDDRKMSEYKLQESEVSGLVHVPISDGLSLFSGEVDEISCQATRIENGETKTFLRSVKVSDLIPRVDSYYLKVFCLARRYLAGDQYLAI